MQGGPITQAEIIELFGDAIPLQAVQLIIDMPARMTFDKVRARLRAIAHARPSAPSQGANMLLSLHQRHLQAMRESNHEIRDRFDNLIQEFEWAFPESAAELKGAFSGRGSSK